MEEKKRIRFEYFQKINTEISSEMVMSIMVLLHNNIPCAKNIFRMRQNFRQTFEDGISFESDEEKKISKKSSGMTASIEKEKQRP
jgi:hypothetical protein